MHTAALNLTRRELLPVLIGVAVVILALIAPALAADFHIIDDHEILRIIAQRPDLAELVNQDLLIGRFRPLYYAIRTVQVALFGGNPLLWHAFVALVGVATGWLLYLALRQFVRPRYALIALAILLLHPYAPMIWVRLSPQEAIGSLLLAAALLGMGAAWRGKAWGDPLFAGCALLAGFYKESFALLLPALIVARLGLQWQARRPLRALLPILLLLVIVGAMQFGLIGMAYLTPDSFGAGQVTRSSSRLQPLIQLFARAGASIPIGIAALVAFRRHRALVLIALAAYALGTIPQAFLYGELLSERYWWPAITVTAGGTAVALEVLTRLGSPRLTVAALTATAITLLVALPNIPRQVGAAAQFTAQTQALDRAVNAAVASDKPIVAVQIAPVQQIEETLSITYHLRFAGFTGRLLLLPLNEPLPRWAAIYRTVYDDLLPVGTPPEPDWYVLNVDAGAIR